MKLLRFFSIFSLVFFPLFASEANPNKSFKVELIDGNKEYKGVKMEPSKKPILNDPITKKNNPQKPSPHQINSDTRFTKEEKENFHGINTSETINDSRKSERCKNYRNIPIKQRPSACKEQTSF